jgi:hypothetical protein
MEFLIKHSQKILQIAFGFACLSYVVLCIAIALNLKLSVQGYEFNLFWKLILSPILAILFLCGNIALFFAKFF